MRSRLSGGGAQRVRLAIALADGSPDVLLLDEPTSSQDLATKELIEASILDAAQRGIAVLLTTHDEQQAERLGAVTRFFAS